MLDENHHKILSDETRLDLIKQLDLVDSPREETFDRLTRLAVKLLSAPISLVSIVESNRQFFKSAIGLNEPWASQRQTPISHSFCQHVVSSGKPLIIENALEHPLVSDNLAIPDIGVISYLGMPLTLQNGQTLGSFCVIDSEIRIWTEEEIEIIQELSQSVITEIELRHRIKQLHQSEQEMSQLLTELQTREAYLQSLINSPNTFVLRTDMDGNFSYLNDAIYSRYKWIYPEAKNMIGQSSLVTIIEQDHQLVRETVTKCLKNPAQSHQVILHKLSQNDEPFIVLFNFSAITDTQGNVSEIQCVGIDITEQKKAEKKAFELALEEEKLKILSEFIQDASHEFRTPLSIINTSADFMVQFDEQEKRQIRADRIGEQVIRITKLVDLLSFIAKLETHKDIEFAPVNINRIIQNIHDTFPPERQEQLHITTLPDDNIPLISGISEYLMRAFYQIIDNALRYSNEGPIQITTSVQDGMLLFSVQDQGIGIAKEDIANLFKLFWRKDEAHTTSGFGIGLYIARMIVERHHGTIEVDSSINEGATFTIRLPLS